VGTKNFPNDLSFVSLHFLLEFNKINLMLMTPPVGKNDRVLYDTICKNTDDAISMLNKIHPIGLDNPDWPKFMEIDTMDMDAEQVKYFNKAMKDYYSGATHWDNALKINKKKKEQL
jgi:hypothetical protein